MAGVISLSLAFRQIVPGTGSFLVAFLEDDTLPFFLEDLFIICFQKGYIATANSRRGCSVQASQVHSQEQNFFMFPKFSFRNL
jgi:hypothetical protein